MSKHASLSHKKNDAIFSGRQKKGRKWIQSQSVNGSRNDTATTYLGWTKPINSCKNLWQSGKSAVGNEMKPATAVDWQRTVVALWNLCEQVCKFNPQKNVWFSQEDIKKERYEFNHKV